MHLLEPREEWPAQREWERDEAGGAAGAARNRWRTKGRKKVEGARISMMINASCGGT